ncbi:uncharacterized protein F4812DRAFT_466921 [Daldinia caldariorum]|uniref:uncharacterized protein n=1 Tax=Daldinia caldariorum TaxID=326644 RepID=UPI002007F188|nr:uncharacterized protein F4812DRAFT_466921 [Daldinia caldariorum]KAI1464680.1 hypothetical protein F4812DRAFT_466921 [Daldinia caldariorum]
MSHNNIRQTMPQSSNPFSLLDVDDAPGSANYPSTEARKVMSDEEQRSDGGPVVASWAGYVANGRMTRTLNQLWIESGESVSAFLERIFEVEYVGLELKAFEGLPAWAVPLPEDFDEEKHIGWATHKYVLERRLHICIEIDPSPKQAWLKPFLDPTMENWIRDSRKRLYGVNKLWEAYDFLCHWALDIARTRIMCPVLYALDNYTQDSIRNLRLGDSIKKNKDKGEEIATTGVRSALKEDAPDDNKYEDSNSGFRRIPAPAYLGHTFSISISVCILIHLHAPPTIRLHPSTSREHRARTYSPQSQTQLTPIPVSDSILALAPALQPIIPPSPKSPEDAIAQMAEATRAGVRADSFKAWSHFFSTQLALQYNHPLTPDSDYNFGSGSGWPSSIDETFRLFLRELCERFQGTHDTNTDADTDAAELREWVRGTSRWVEAYKAEGEERARVDELLRRALDGRGQE